MMVMEITARKPGFSIFHQLLYSNLSSNPPDEGGSAGSGWLINANFNAKASKNNTGTIKGFRSLNIPITPKNIIAAKSKPCL